MFERESPRDGATLIANAALILPDEIVEGGALRVEAGVIAEVAASRAAVRGEWTREIDAGGAYLMPGVIDLHNDSLETEINPRPETDLPLEFALANLERRLLPFGVTTEFHAISFMDMPRSRRTVGDAVVRAEYIAAHRASGRALIDHQILHRLDVWSPATLDTILASLDRFPLRYLSLNDHTPGQGQYRDLDGYLERMRSWTAQRGGVPPDEREVHDRIAARAADTATLAAVYGRVRGEIGRGPLVVASHDDDTAAKVDELHELGARVAEFPVTLAAARRARERGMAIVVGAPNIVRGGSSSGNQDARELVAHGLADVICADYHAPSLLRSVFRLVAEGLCDLPVAVRMVTINAADAVGMKQVGGLIEGWRADLVLLRPASGGVPHVEAVFRAGRAVYTLRAQQPVGATT